MKRKIKHLIIGIKCLFGHHTEDPNVHIIYGDKRAKICICCRQEFT